MTRIVRKASIPVLLLITSAAIAGEYSDPSGFSLKFPDDWSAVSMNGKGLDVTNAPPAVRNWIEKNKIDLSKVTMMLMPNNPQGEFVDNINVVALPQELPITPAAMTQMVDAMKNQYQAMGVQLSNLENRIGKVGDRDAIIIEYTSRNPTVPAPLRQRQYAVAGGGKTFIVTCTTKQDFAAKSMPVFDSIAQSLQVPPARSNNWIANAVKGGVNGGIIGAVAGAAAVVVLGLVKLLRSKSSSKSPPRVPPERDVQDID